MVVVVLLHAQITHTHTHTDTPRERTHANKRKVDFQQDLPSANTTYYKTGARNQGSLREHLSGTRTCSADSFRRPVPYCPASAVAAVICIVFRVPGLAFRVSPIPIALLLR